MKKILPLTFLLLATLACSLTGLTEIFVPSGGLLYQDSFSSPQSGWGEMVSPVGAAGYADGAYRIVLNEPNVHIWSHPGMDYSTVHMEVSVYPFAGPQENRMGLVCRLKDDKNFYFFVISADGYYGIGKMKDGQASLLSGGGQMVMHESIQKGTVANLMRADCIGSLLILYVNDMLVGSVEDADFASGDVGILAGTFTQPGADVYFDNFVVFKP